ncbi:hypothetical protein LWI28_023399 [Acer negundo]|uniref:Calmodulin-binding protein 60 A-like n=1 Tax=Acer negundo TaxID=4023 RepID=A0AAD5J6H1_ACENE|nr:hypothetical protein LWI28_023399 [Acer negundo]KAK4852339.1 hypothetical protein QYF36_023115 [Acer negundo]
MTRGTEYVMVFERVMERVLLRVMQRKLERAMSRWIRKMERETNRQMKGEMKRLIGRTQGAPADWNVNPRTPLDHQIKKSEEVILQLMFPNKLHHTFFTKDKIRDKNGKYVEIKLIDTVSRKTVEVGPLSSIGVEIHVLDGDFGYEGYENWTGQEFNAKIVCQREGKGPLVKGKQKIMLMDGVGTIQDLSFSDNSSWIKCKKFRLGARVVQIRNDMSQVRIKEAVSEAFAVMGHRSKRIKKHLLPSLDDEVWHLKKITRGGKFHTRLIDNNVQTVRNFKQMYTTNPIKLREILKDCSDSGWEVIVHEASGVGDDEKLNTYSNPLISPTTGQLPDHKFPVPHQGSAGMKNDSSTHASTSHVNVGCLLD